MITTLIVGFACGIALTLVGVFLMWLWAEIDYYKKGGF
jgi:hypothetical protein